MSLNPSYAPQNETSSDIWYEVSTMIGDSVLASFAFGVLFCLWVLCLNSLIPQVKIRANRNWAIFHIVYVTVVFALVGIGNAGNARLVQIYWINNRDYPGGPLAFISEQTNLSILLWGWAVYIAASWLQDAYVLYRCLIFWNYNWWVGALPSLCLVGSIATSIGILVEISTPGKGLTSPLAIDFAICWYIFSVSINVIATIAIVARLLYKRQSITALLGRDHSRVYTGVAAMLIESAALYSVFGLIFIGTYFKQNPVNNIVLPILGNLEGICPLMIIYRISIGRGWTNKTMQEITNSLPTMEFRVPEKKAPDSRVTHTTGWTGSSSVTNVDGLESMGDLEMPEHGLRHHKMPSQREEF